MKPGVFTQLYVQLVFSVHYRECFLKEKYRGEIFKYMSGIITNQKHKSIIVNGVDDHVHILIGLNPSGSISDLVHDIKRNSSLFINGKKWFRNKFGWQEGYGAFSYGRSQLEKIYRYIDKQEDHHRKRTFRDEYVSLLQKFRIEHDKKFLFKFFD